MKSAIYTLALASAALAKPLYKRQEVSSASEAATSVASELSSVLESATSEVASATSSAVESASGSASASSAAASASQSVFPAYPCPSGFLLTYVIGNVEYPDITLEQGVQALSNWATAVPFPVTTSTGTNETGATRTLDINGTPVQEVLVNQTIDATTGQLHAIWNLTAPYAVTPNLNLASAQDDFTLYSNTTTGVTTAQLFTNACASDQQAALTTLDNAATLQAYGAFIRNSTSGGASASGSASASGASASAAPSEAASSAVESATSAIDSLASSASEAVASAAPSA